METLYETREAWLNAFADAMRPKFASLGVPLPEKVRIAIAFTSGGTRGKSIGECWDSRASRDGSFEIMIRPDHEDAFKICETTLHELIHAAVGLECKHGGKFKAIATVLGFQAPVRSGGLHDEAKAAIMPTIEALGPMPHAALDFANRPKKKQATAMIKCECETCGYVVRTTKKWLAVGLPHCPIHGEMTSDFEGSLEDGE